MISISNSDYAKAKRLLKALSNSRGVTLRERENARKAYLLLVKWENKELRNNKSNTNTK